MEQPKEERRKATRIKKQIEVQYRQDASSERWDTTFAKDFSGLGMLITTEKFFAPNTILNFRMKLPSEPYNWLLFNGRVIECEKKVVGSYDNSVVAAYSVRIEFIDIDPEGQKTIQRYITWYLSKGGGVR